jgi:hypothetical protein
MLPAILQGAQSAFQIGTGIAQLIKSGKIRPVRPGYDFEAMNRGQLENRNMFMNAMNAGMPGLQNQMKGIDTSQANMQANVDRSATDSSTALLMANVGQSRSNEAKADLGVKSAMFSANMMGNLAGANASLDQGRQQAFQFNEVEPYMMDLQRKQQLAQSGLSAINQGLGTAASAVGTAMGARNSLTSIPQYKQFLRGLKPEDYKKMFYME